MEDKLKQIASKLGDKSWTVKVTSDPTMNPGGQTALHWTFTSASTGDTSSKQEKVDISGVTAQQITVGK